ncbi:MAG: flavodoxin family protein, partial [candidate division Zixibacteria bacterium]|nr:flavodoxin family protein [candidate division Zixibacteria bacterium]
MALRVLGIMGSPRTGSNTDILLDAALEGAAGAGARVEKLSINRLQVAPCRECYQCRVEGVCVIRDDMDEVGKKLLAADRVIIASPIFFYGLSGQLKALVDRGQSYWIRKYELV